MATSTTEAIRKAFTGSSDQPDPAAVITSAPSQMPAPVNTGYTVAEAHVIDQMPELQSLIGGMNTVTKSVGGFGQAYFKYQKEEWIEQIKNASYLIPGPGGEPVNMLELPPPELDESELPEDPAERQKAINAHNKAWEVSRGYPTLRQKAVKYYTEVLGLPDVSAIPSVRRAMDISVANNAARLVGKRLQERIHELSSLNSTESVEDVAQEVIAGLVSAGNEQNFGLTQNGYVNQALAPVLSAFRARIATSRGEKKLKAHLARTEQSLDATNDHLINLTKQNISLDDFKKKAQEIYGQSQAVLESLRGEGFKDEADDMARKQASVLLSKINTAWAKGALFSWMNDEDTAKIWLIEMLSPYTRGKDSLKDVQELEANGKLNPLSLASITGFINDLPPIDKNVVGAWNDNTSAYVNGYVQNEANYEVGILEQAMSEELTQADSDKIAALTDKTLKGTKDHINQQREKANLSPLTESDLISLKGNIEDLIRREIKRGVDIRDNTESEEDESHAIKLDRDLQKIKDTIAAERLKYSKAVTGEERSRVIQSMKDTLNTQITYTPGDGSEPYEIDVVPASYKQEVLLQIANMRLVSGHQVTFADAVRTEAKSQLNKLEILGQQFPEMGAMIEALADEIRLVEAGIWGEDVVEKLTTIQAESPTSEIAQQNARAYLDTTVMAPFTSMVSDRIAAIREKHTEMKAEAAKNTDREPPTFPQIKKLGKEIHGEAAANIADAVLPSGATDDMSDEVDKTLTAAQYLNGELGAGHRRTGHKTEDDTPGRNKGEIHIPAVSDTLYRWLQTGGVHNGHGIDGQYVHAYVDADDNISTSKTQQSGTHWLRLDETPSDWGWNRLFRFLPDQPDPSNPIRTKSYNKAVAKAYLPIYGVALKEVVEMEGGEPKRDKKTNQLILKKEFFQACKDQGLDWTTVPIGFPQEAAEFLVEGDFEHMWKHSQSEDGFNILAAHASIAYDPEKEKLNKERLSAAQSNQHTSRFNQQVEHARTDFNRENRVMSLNANSTWRGGPGDNDLINQNDAIIRSFPDANKIERATSDDELPTNEDVETPEPPKAPRVRTSRGTR